MQWSDWKEDLAFDLGVPASAIEDVTNEHDWTLAVRAEYASLLRTPARESVEGTATEQALEFLRKKVKQAHEGEYAVDPRSISDIASFVASHRKGVIWAVLVGLAIREATR